MNEFLVVKISKKAVEGDNGELILTEVKDYLSKQPNNDYRKLRNSLTQYLVKKGKRQTIERFKVLEKISSKQIFSIKAIHELVSQDIHVSIKTVSSTFNLLENAGIIKPVFEIREKFKPAYFEIK